MSTTPLLADTSRTTMLKELLGTPIAIGFIAVSVILGAGTAAANPLGIGTAALISGSSAGSSTIPSPAPGTVSDSYQWMVINYTAKPLSQVRFEKYDESIFSSYRTESSILTADSIAPLGHAAAYFSTPSGWDHNVNRTAGTLCYEGTRWELPAQQTGGFEWHEVGIFAGPNGKGGVQLIATPAGAGDDRGLLYRGIC